MFDVGLPELLIILGVALIVLGPQRLPELARSLGKALGELRRTSDDLRRNVLFGEGFEAETHVPPSPAAVKPIQQDTTHTTGTGDSKASPSEKGVDEEVPSHTPQPPSRSEG